MFSDSKQKGTDWGTL